MKELEADPNTELTLVSSNSIREPYNSSTHDRGSPGLSALRSNRTLYRKGSTSS
jgi:hypothetical protein